MACNRGYYGPFCNSPCPPGTFGNLCAGLCAPKCLNADCDNVLGCPDHIIENQKEIKPVKQCEPGFYGQLCESHCPNGTFGYLCGGLCSPTCSEIECHFIHGCPKHTEVDKQSKAPERYRSTINNTDFFIISTELVISSKENEAIIPNTGSAFNTVYMYLFIGIGSIVSLLLILTLIQLYIKCKSSKRKAKAKCKRSKTNTLSINSNPALSDDQGEYTVAEGGCVNHPPYQSLKAVYAEIPENIEMHTKKISNPKNTMVTLPSYLPLKSEKNSSNCPTGDNSTEPNLAGSSLDSTTSSLYISPVFIPEGTCKEDSDEDISLL